MRFRKVYKNPVKWYMLGIDEDTNTYVLSVAVGRVLLQTAYFRLTPEEFENYPNNRAKIDELAEQCARQEKMERYLPT